MAGILQFSRRSISKEVAMGLVITIVLVSTVSFFVAHRVARKKADAQLDAKADEYIQYLKEILTVPIWNYDYETIDVIGKTYLQNDHIAGIAIADSRGNTWVSATKDDSVPLVRRSAGLTHHGMPIGSVEISLSSGFYNVWNRQFFWYFGFIILINLLSMIIMTGFLLRWSLNKPLQLLNRIVASYDSEKKEFSPYQMPYSEFMPLIATLRGMGDEIKSQMAALQKAEKKYRSIFENATEGIFQSTFDGRILNANPAFARILGYGNPEELIASVVDVGREHYVNPEQRKVFLDRIEKKRVIKSYEVQFKKVDGGIIWVSLNAIPVYNSRGVFQHIEGLVQDITARKKVETEVRRLSTAVEQVAQSIIIADDAGRIKYVNPAFENTTGHRMETVSDHPVRFLGADEAERNLYDEVFATVSEGKVWTGRLTSRKQNGEELIEDAIASPIKSPVGRFLGYVSLNRDVTLKARYETQLRQSQKMEAIGTLAGGIAHDFNNILGVIIGCSELVRNRLPRKDKAIKDIEQVLTASLRAKALVNQILTFSRQEEARKIPLVLSPFISEVIHFLKATLPKYVRIDYTRQDASGVVLADPIQMQQIFMNLCTNAAQAIGANRGKIEVVLSRVNYAEEDERPPDISPGSYVMIEIRDDGPGIEEKIEHKIFDPFFTTKAIGEGTGLGLSVVHGIVKKHEGTIAVESREGRGATFRLLFPRIGHEDFRIAVEPVPELPSGSEKILLVDDEKVLLNILDRILSSLGYDVEAYDNSPEALAAFLKKTDAFDLVITDQVMPDLTGSRLTREIQKQNPRVPVILFTGFDEVPPASAGADRPRFSRVIKKPLMNTDFAFTVRKVLDEHRGGGYRHRR